MVINDWYETPLEITASDQWQEIEIRAEQLINRSNKLPLKSWAIAAKIAIKPGKESDISKVVFADFKWGVRDKK